MTNLAAFASHREHLRRAAITDREPLPHNRTASPPVSVLAAPHARHSTFSPARNLTRSPTVRMCFVLIPIRYGNENDSGTTGHE